jgi:nicotinamide-nucleotide amidase
MNEPFASRTLRTIGIGESVLEEKLSDTIKPFINGGLEVGYCARPGQVDVRLIARGPGAEKQVADAEAAVHEQLGSCVFGTDDDELAAVIVRMLTERGETLTVAESCTGGHIANQLTDVPGASVVFRAGLVVYSNEAKQQFLGVNAETIAQHGAVSEAVAREMAANVRKINSTDYGIGVTGIAGPAGGTPDKPVGTVFMAIASAGGVTAWRELNPWDRLTFKEVTARQALNRLRLLMKKIP